VVIPPQLSARIHSRQAAHPAGRHDALRRDDNLAEGDQAWPGVSAGSPGVAGAGLGSCLPGVSRGLARAGRVLRS